MPIQTPVSGLVNAMTRKNLHSIWSIIAPDLLRRWIGKNDRFGPKNELLWRKSRINVYASAEKNEAKRIGKERIGEVILRCPYPPYRNACKLPFTTLDFQEYLPIVCTTRLCKVLQLALSAEITKMNNCKPSETARHMHDYQSEMVRQHYVVQRRIIG